MTANKFRKPFRDEGLKTFIANRFSTMKRKELRKRMRKAADDPQKRVIDLPTITTKGTTP